MSMMKRNIMKTKSSRCKDLARKVQNSATIGDFFASGNGQCFGNITIKGNSDLVSNLKENAKTFQKVRKEVREVILPKMKREQAKMITVAYCSSNELVSENITNSKLTYIQEVLKQ